MDLSEIIRSNLGVSVISLLAGALIAAVGTKLRGKRARLRYSTRTDRLALAADDPIFGTVRISWREQAVRNLYMASVEIENTSSRDFEDVDFKVYTDNGTYLLNERTGIVGTPYIVGWADFFRAAVAVAQGTEPTADQWNRYYHSREYRVQVFNRAQLLQFNYLCTRPNDDAQPAVFVSTQLKGAKLRHEVRSNLLFGVPVQATLTRGLTVSTVAVLLCGFLLRSVWVAGFICVTVGLSAQLLGWLVTRLNDGSGSLFLDSGQRLRHRLCAVGLFAGQRVAQTAVVAVCGSHYYPGREGLGGDKEIPGGKKRAAKARHGAGIQLRERHRQKNRGPQNPEVRATRFVVEMERPEIFGMVLTR